MDELLNKKKDFLSIIIPKLFRIVHKENSRGGKIGMEAGKGRERALISLFKQLISTEQKIDGDMPDTFPEGDCIFKGIKKNELISIKTYTGNGIKSGTDGIKICWTSDKDSCKKFVKDYLPIANILIINIPRHNKQNKWDNKQTFLYYIFLETQLKIIEKLNNKNYLKIPKKGTNSRGICLSKNAIKELFNNKNTIKIPIRWNGERIDKDYDPEKRWKILVQEELKIFNKLKIVK